MPIGAGGCPAGSSPAGYGVIDTATAPNLVPLPDPRTGLSQGGRNIDQATKDYTFTSDGRLQGMPNVNQLVLIAIQNADFSTITEKGPNFAQQLRDVVQNALADLITRNLVKLTTVTVLDRQPGMNPDAGVAIAYWIDLTTGQPQQTPF